MPVTTEQPKRVYPRVDVEEVPELEHWVSLPTAGHMLGLTRQRAYGWAAEKRFETLRKIQSTVEGTDGRPFFVVKRTEVERLVRKRAREEAAAKAKKEREAKAEAAARAKTAAARAAKKLL